MRPESEIPTEPHHAIPTPESPEMLLLRTVAADTSFVRGVLEGALLRLADVERRQSQVELWIARHPHSAGL